MGVSVDNPGLPLFGVSPFSNAKSDSQGIGVGNLGVTHDISGLGLPATFGLALAAGAGAGVDFRQVPESNGTYASVAALDIAMSSGILLTDNLGVGGSLLFSNTTLAGPFVGVTGAASDYGLAGKFGLDYRLSEATTAGFYWKTQTNYRFDNIAAAIGGGFQDIRLDRPETIGMGVANRRLMDGRLLLAMDAVFLQYTKTALLGALYKDQWALQFGAQYAATNRCRLRLGYAWNQNPLRDLVGDNAGGIFPPGGVAHIQYVQALFAAIPQHRLTGGFGVEDILPGIDLDMFAGGMFAATQRFGVTTASLDGYWVGFGMTWRFGAS